MEPKPFAVFLIALSFPLSSAFADEKTADPNWGPNVFVFDPQMPMEEIQATIDRVYEQQRRNEFDDSRFAFLFKPGSYRLDVKVGYYTQALGLGRRPDDVVITGAVRSKSNRRGNVLTNFWRGSENMAVVPTLDGELREGPRNIWAVSQAAPFRRMHVRGDLQLHDDGYASGGFMADCLVDGQVDSGPQQQWFTRNSVLGGWKGGVWNMFFLGVDNPPPLSWPHPPYTVIDTTPRVREKPFLMLAPNGTYGVFVPALREHARGVTWAEGPGPGRLLPLDRFHIARPERDDASALNAALAQGRHLLLTPGVYSLLEPLRVNRPDTIILGLGIATLRCAGPAAAVEVADVDGVILAGLLLDAGKTNSPVLLQVGPTGCDADHSKNPISLHDIFCRVGGAGAGRADCSVLINSRHVIGDHFWLWRADHGKGVGWEVNTSKNGLIVNGDDVTIYGLFVEHYHEVQTLWNGNGGRLYFYQSEMPYDPPSPQAWGRDGTVGYASYKVADHVSDHEAWGLGIYCVFRAAPIIAQTAIEAPEADGVKLRHMVTIRLSGQPDSGIRRIVNNAGDSVITKQKAVMTRWPVK